MVDKCNLVVLIIIPLSLLLNATLITLLFLSKFSTMQNTEMNRLATVGFSVNEDYVKRIKRDTDREPTPDLYGCVFNLKKSENDQDKILRWTSYVTSNKDVASVNNNGRIRFHVTGWFKFSLSLTVNSYVQDKCLGDDSFTRIQVQVLKNKDQLIHYLPNIIKKGELRQVGISGYPVLMYKDEEIFVRVTKPHCIYSQSETGYLAMTRIS